MAIFSGTGDDGTTSLPGDVRVSKNDPRIEACGALDELGATLGLAACVADVALTQRLRQIQSELLVMGAHVAATIETMASQLAPLDPTALATFEQEIVQAEAALPPLGSFILAGGNELSAHLHLARTVCRRAERRVAAVGPLTAPSALVYLNRLSDWLFMQARLANSRDGIADILWRP